MAKTLYIIDGHSQIYRAYYAPFRDLTSPTGEPTRATFVFAQQLLTLINKRKPDYLVMAVDGPSAELERRAAYSEYKANRKPMPEDLLPQVTRIREIVAGMNIPVLQCPGHEADDIIATLAETYAREDIEVVIVSRDKDLDQLITEHVVLYDPQKDQTLDAPTLLAEKGYTPQQAVEIQTLTGDATDNIPGVPGVGAKTALKLIEKYGTADAVVQHADEQTPKLRESLQNYADTLPLTRQLVTLRRDVPMTISLEDMSTRTLTPRAVRELFEQLGFTRLLDQLDALTPREQREPQQEAKANGNSFGGLFNQGSPERAGDPTGAVGGLGEKAQTPQEGQTGALQAGEAQASVSSGTLTTASDFAYRCVDTPEALDALARELQGVKRLSVDTETTSVDPMRAEMVGMSLAWKAGEGVYLPVRGPLGAVTLPLERVRDALGPILSDPSVQKIGQNLKYDLIVLANAGFEIRGELFDTMIAAHVLDSTRMTYKLDALSLEYLQHRCIPIEDVIGRGKNQISMATAAVDVVTVYAAEDADVSLRLADALDARLRSEGLMDLFRDLEMPLMPILTQMERTGVRVDPAALKRLEMELSKEADVLRDRIVATAGRPFNPDSPKQLAEILFTDLKLPVQKRTKTGPSTDSFVLEDLAPLHELPGLILDYRRLTKLIGTYTKALAGCIHPRTGRVHTSFHQTGTVTGRLSSSDPNLQNIPVRTEEGKLIRAAFIADEGNLLLSADYSQVELRVLAHFCEDEKLIAAFRNDQDIHRIVAAEVFGVSPEDVTPEQRSKAKGVNFGIIYGQTAFGLARGLRIPREDAARFITAYRARFPKIQQFLSQCIEQAQRYGYVETIFKRRRRITGLDSSNQAVRAGAERLAINSVVQGSAADLIKQAMLNIARRIEAEGRPARMLLQIHDELVFEAPAAAVEAEADMVASEMARAIDLRVPLKVEVGIGKNWMEAK